MWNSDERLHLNYSLNAISHLIWCRPFLINLMQSFNLRNINVHQIILQFPIVNKQLTISRLLLISVKCTKNVTQYWLDWNGLNRMKILLESNCFFTFLHRVCFQNTPCTSRTSLSRCTRVRTYRCLSEYFPWARAVRLQRRPAFALLQGRVICHRCRQPPSEHRRQIRAAVITYALYITSTHSSRSVTITRH